MMIFQAPVTYTTAGMMRKHYYIATILAVLFLFLDQLTKELVVRCIKAQFIPVIPGFFDLTHVRNQGAAFGMLSGYRYFLLIVSFAALTAILLFQKKLVEGYTERIYALLLICSGIVGNCLDRIFRGDVVDFLRFYLGKYEWPSFNIADSCITVGVAVFIVSTLFRPEKKNRP